MEFKFTTLQYHLSLTMAHIIRLADHIILSCKHKQMWQNDLLSQAHEQHLQGRSAGNLSDKIKDLQPENVKETQICMFTMSQSTTHV